MQRLRDGFRVVADAVMVGYDYEHPACHDSQVLVDVPALEVRGLMEAGLGGRRVAAGLLLRPDAIR